MRITKKELKKQMEEAIRFANENRRTSWANGYWTGRAMGIFNLLYLESKGKGDAK